MAPRALHSGVVASAGARGALRASAAPHPTEGELALATCKGASCGHGRGPERTTTVGESVHPPSDSGVRLCCGAQRRCRGDCRRRRSWQRSRDPYKRQTRLRRLVADPSLRAKMMAWMAGRRPAGPPPGVCGAPRGVAVSSSSCSNRPGWCRRYQVKKDSGRVVSSGSSVGVSRHTTGCWPAHDGTHSTGPVGGRPRVNRRLPTGPSTCHYSGVQHPCMTGCRRWSTLERGACFLGGSLMLLEVHCSYDLGRQQLDWIWAMIK